jgi:fluoroacetyl-CoA thioesterase
MKEICKQGDKKEYRRVIQQNDIASFHGQIVHPVCSTFSLARDIEWTTRQFVLDMRDDDEEGIGTFLSIDHKSPAFVGEEIIFTARIDQISGNELICSFEAKVDNRVIATGKTGQKILKKEKIDKIFKQVPLPRRGI